MTSTMVHWSGAWFDLELRDVRFGADAGDAEIEIQIFVKTKVTGGSLK